jgi:hypothetical protein
MLHVDYKEFFVQTLKEINFEGNKIENDGAKAVAQVLQNKTTVKLIFSHCFLQQILLFLDISLGTRKDQS